MNKEDRARYTEEVRDIVQRFEDRDGFLYVDEAVTELVELIGDAKWELQLEFERAVRSAIESVR